MESDFDPRQALLDTERATAASWIDFPPTPRWYAPAVGAWATGFLATLTVLDRAASMVVTVVLVALLLVYVRWYRRYRRTMPRFQAAPAELRPVIAGFFVGMAVVVAVLAAAVVWLPAAATLVLAFALVTGAIALYEQRYAEACAAARTRLG